MFELLKFGLLFALEAGAASIARNAYPEHGFERRWLAPRQALIKLHVAVRQADRGAAVERQLLQASDPNSPSFRQHLDANEVLALSSPREDSVRAVEHWLSQHGLLKDANLFAGLFEIDTTIRDAEKLLNTTYFVYSDGLQDVVRTEQYHLPEEVADHVDFVTPTTNFPRVSMDDRTTSKRAVQRAAVVPTLTQRASCGSSDYSTPDCIRQVYGINYTATPNRTTFAVFATEQAKYNNSDLQTWLKKYNPVAEGATYEISGNGDPTQSAGGIEQQFEVSLDTQTLLGLAWPAKGILYNRGGVFGSNVGQTYDNFVTFLTELMTNETYPSVVSFSESTPENRFDPAYAVRLCNMMAQVGARGITLLFSSGNNGPNGDQPSGDHKAIFEPEFPASCPWVTAVGGTTDLADEKAATKGNIPALSAAGFTASGGGFSNLFAAPEWQANITASYIKQYVPTSYQSESGFNATGRGIPDVSAFSTQFPTQVGILDVPIGGTSAATPVWAAVITLLNDYEASKNRSSLGFINPWLYSLKSGLKDITKGGNNKGDCNLLEGCKLSKTLGYNTTEGWDPVTGLGSPIFPELVQVLDSTACFEDLVRGFMFGGEALLKGNTPSST